MLLKLGIEIGGKKIFLSGNHFSVAVLTNFSNSSPPVLATKSCSIVWSFETWLEICNNITTLPLT